jgi:aminoglycoside phosphotransferase family enzyme/predicted kinase
MDIHELLNGLSDPTAYPGRVDQIELRQTHISIVSLTGEFVYKIKKPVKFPFLDFSSLDKRRFFCEREVALNRRLAPQIYLGVVPIVIRDGRIAVETSGEPIEWAVKMRRLPEVATLENQLIRGEVDSSLMQLLGQRLADFHQQTQPDPQMAEYGRYAAIAQNINDNLTLEQQHGRVIDSSVMSRLLSLTLNELNSARELIERRAEAGVPRDCHGDLHLDHVYVFPNELPPADLCIIDCIEFNDAFRYIDPVADLAFLIMDFKFHGFPELARELADAYFKASGDQDGPRLLPLYVSYRAAVRAKVESLELTETEVPTAERAAIEQRARAHWLLALSGLEVPSRRPCLLLIGGLPGTGKSTLAAELSENSGFTVIRSDVVRKELASVQQVDVTIKHDYQTGLYAPDWIERTYTECLRRAIELLEQGERVIVDASFSQDVQRQCFLAAAKKLALPGLCFICQAEPEIIQNRLRQRTGDASDADWTTYQYASRAWESVILESSRQFVEINTGKSDASALEQVRTNLREAGLL